MKTSGGSVARDNGSYWIQMPCVYQDYVTSKPQGSSWSYAIFVSPKYGHPIWQGAATKMLSDVAAHYDGSGVAFMLGMDGLDGEFGNLVPNAFAGCNGIRAALVQQYKVSADQMLWRDMAATWRKASPHSLVWSSCTSLCDPAWFADLTPPVGLFQARAVPDGANYHRSGDIGALDWAVRFNAAGKPVAWENAYPNAGSEYLYRMFSVVGASWPRFFSFVGSSWSGDQAVIAPFVASLGETITTTQTVWWRAYWTCYAWPDTIDCPDDTLDEGTWSQYSGWPHDIERGITSTAKLPLVNPWTQLAAAQRTGLWWHCCAVLMWARSFRSMWIRPGRCRRW